MKNRIFHNWLLKLTSVVCAVVLWIIIYSVEDPVDATTMYNVPVTLINTEVVTDENQIYEVLDNSDVLRRLSIQSTRSVIDSLNDSDIRVEADFKKMKLDGTIELKIYSDRYNDSITFKPSATEMKVSVEDRKERYLSIEVSLTGEPKEGYIVGSSKLAQNRISVSGAESVINSIEKVMAIVDIEDTAGDVFSYADIILLDAEGKEIPKDRIDMSMKTVSTTVEILATKTVPVVYQVSGEVAEGFFVTGDVYSEVNDLLIAGHENALAKVTEIIVAGEKMSVADAKQDVISVVDLDNYLPSGIIRAEKEGNGQVEVTMPVVPIVDKEYILRMDQVQLVNIPEGYSVDYVQSSTEMTVVVQGPEHLLEQLSVDDIKGTIDVTAWMEANEKERFRNEEILSIVAEYDIAEHIEVIDSAPLDLIAMIEEELKAP